MLNISLNCRKNFLEKKRHNSYFKKTILKMAKIARKQPKNSGFEITKVSHGTFFCGGVKA